MTQRIRIGIIGANWGMVGHLPVLRMLPDVEVVAVCTSRETSARKAAEQYDIPKPYWDFRQMVRDPDIDLVDVGTKPSNRYAMVMAALEAGKHVVNANPFALTLDQAEEMVNTQHQRGLFGAVEAQLPWTPQISRMRELLQDGYIGDLFNVTCRCHYVLLADGDATWPMVSFPPGYPPGSEGYKWLGDSSSGGSALRNLGGHCLYVLLDLFGDVEELVAHQETCLKQWSFPDGSTLEPETPDVALVIMRFKNGGTAQLNISWSVADGRGFAVEAYGSKGRLRVSSTSGFPNESNSRLLGAKVGMRDRSGVQEQPIETPDHLYQTRSGLRLPPDGRMGMTAMLRMWEDLLGAMRQGTKFAADFDRALHVQRIVEAADLSTKTRSWIRLDSLSN